MAARSPAPGSPARMRHIQLPPSVDGVLMRPCAPRRSQSAMGMIAVSQTLESAARTIASVKSASSPTPRYSRAKATSSGGALSIQSRVVVLSCVPV